MLGNDWDGLAETLSAISGPQNLAVRSVMGRNPLGMPYAYTVGLHARQHPELLITGLAGALGEQVLRRVASQVVDFGSTLRVGDTLQNVAANHKFRILEMDAAHNSLLTMAGFVYPDLKVCYQVVFDDAAGRWVWEEGCEVSRVQRLLGPAHPGNSEDTHVFGWVLPD